MSCKIMSITILFIFFMSPQLFCTPPASLPTELLKPPDDGIYQIDNVSLKYIPPMGWKIKVLIDSPSHFLEFVPPSPKRFVSFTISVTDTFHIPSDFNGLTKSEIVERLMKDATSDRAWQVTEKKAIPIAGTTGVSWVEEFAMDKHKRIEFFKDGILVLISILAEGYYFDEILPAIDESLKTLEIISPAPR